MSEMVERVAKLLSEARGCEHSFPCPFCLWAPDDLTKQSDETGCIWMARAAIGAMREPTEAMIEAGVTADTGKTLGERATNCHRAMIDEALK